MASGGGGDGQGGGRGVSDQSSGDEGGDVGVGYSGGQCGNGLGAIRRNDGSGLNVNRQRGFNFQQNMRIATTSLNDMRAKEGAIVSKFMTFLKRKNTFVFDLYEKVFFQKKTKWASNSRFCL